MNKQLFAQTAPPPPRGRGRGCGAERRQWRMQRGGAPAAVEKIEQASSAKIFSGTARRWGRCACGYLGSVSVRSTDDALASFVSSTASDRKGFVKGESVPLDPLLPPFGGAKGGPRRVGVLTKPCKRLRDADRRDEIWYERDRGARVRGCDLPRNIPSEGGAFCASFVLWRAACRGRNIPQS